MCKNDIDLFLIVYRGEPVASVDSGGKIHYIDKEKLRDGLKIIFAGNTSPMARIAWAYVEDALK